jgi:hypothetical protein
MDAITLSGRRTRGGTRPAARSSSFAVADRGGLASAVGFREERVGANEAIFREVNERIESLAGQFAKLAGRLGWDAEKQLQLICECDKVTCAEGIRMSRAEYEAVRADDTHFALYPGHADLEVERVISSHPDYEIVAKDGPAAEVARDLSRR